MNNLVCSMAARQLVDPIHNPLLDDTYRYTSSKEHRSLMTRKPPKL